MTQSHDAAPQPPDPAAGQPAYAAPPAAPPAGGAPPQVSKPSGGGKLLKVLLGIGIVIVVLGVMFYLLKDDPGRAEVGDCISGATAEDVVVVECGSAEAKWEVIGKVKDKTEAEMQTACGEFPEAEQAFWQGEKDGKGFVLCMKPAK